MLLCSLSLAWSYFDFVKSHCLFIISCNCSFYAHLHILLVIVIHHIFNQVNGLQATLRNLETGKDEKIPPLSGYRDERMVLGDGPTQSALREARRNVESNTDTRDTARDASAMTEDNRNIEKHENVSSKTPFKSSLRMASRCFLI